MTLFFTSAFFYVIALTVLSFKSHSSGRDVWKMSVKEADFAGTHTPPTGTPGFYQPKNTVVVPPVQQTPTIQNQNQYPPVPSAPYYQV